MASARKSLKWIESIDGHHVVAFILVASVLLSSLLLAGCASNASAMSDIYLFALRYSNGSQTTVRAGYFGLCASEAPASGNWACSNSGEGLKAKLGGSGKGNESVDVIDMAAQYKTGVVFPGLILAGAALSLVAGCSTATFPNWHEEHDHRTGSDIDIKAFPSGRVQLASVWCSVMASLFSLVAALWQHVAGAAAAFVVETMTNGHLKATVGPAAMSLGWLALALNAVVALVLVSSAIEVINLDKLTD